MIFRTVIHYNISMLQFWDTPQLESTYNHTQNQNERRNEGKRKINQTTPLLFCFVLFQFLVFRRLFILFHCISFSSFLFVLLRLCLSFKPKWQQQQLAEAEALKNLSIPLFILHLSFKFVYFISFAHSKKSLSLFLSFQVPRVLLSVFYVLQYFISICV